MSNMVATYRDSLFWSLQGRYSSFALQKIKTHLQEAGYRGVVFHYQLLSMGLLLKTFQKAPRLQQIITSFEGAYTFDKKTAPSKALQTARQVNLVGLRELATQYVDTNLESINQEAHSYWLGTLQRLEQQAGAATPQEDSQRIGSLAKFLVKYYTLMSQVRRMEPDFSIEKIKREAANSRALDQGERENEAVEAIGRRLYPELFNKEQQKATKKMEKATMGKGLDLAALGLERHEWLGSQKELAELFIELERKGWIKEKKVETIQASFTKSDTIDQILKPNRDFMYPEVFTPSYRPRFDAIKQKPASKHRK